MRIIPFINSKLRTLILSEKLFKRAQQINVKISVALDYQLYISHWYTEIQNGAFEKLKGKYALPIES